MTSIKIHMKNVEDHVKSHKILQNRWQSCKINQHHWKSIKICVGACMHATTGSTKSMKLSYSWVVKLDVPVRYTIMEARSDTLFPLLGVIVYDLCMIWHHFVWFDMVFYDFIGFCVILNILLCPWGGSTLPRNPISRPRASLDRRSVGWTVNRTDGQTVEQTDGWTDGRTNGSRSHGRLDDQMDGRSEGWLDGRMDRRSAKRSDRQPAAESCLKG